MLKKPSGIMFLIYLFDINFVMPKIDIMILINISTCRLTCFKQIGHYIKRNILVCLHMLGCRIRMSLNTRLVSVRIELIKRKIIYAWHEFSNTVECRYNAIQYNIVLYAVLLRLRQSTDELGASFQICIVEDCACAGNSGNIFPATAG